MANTHYTDEFLHDLTGILRDAKDFSVTQAPDVVKQVLRAALYGDVFLLLLGLSGLLISLYCAHRFRNRAKGDYLDESGATWFTTGLLLGLTGLCGTLCPLYDLLTFWVAPKVYLIDYAAQQVRGCR